MFGFFVHFDVFHSCPSFLFLFLAISIPPISSPPTHTIRLTDGRHPFLLPALDSFILPNLLPSLSSSSSHISPNTGLPAASRHVISL
ncbi:uncharacterized protein IWZ02DRAFT_457815 [Phyllosticta citriasiana]|uniref:uncharacterized protein n=1 Tax=Phyllosticta citriasiana TaxID=595635 RepID=UPI0030FDA6EB